jgi:hypothetical protein
MELFRMDHEITTVLHDMTDDELHAFAELHEDLASDEEIELYIYICFLNSNRMRATESLEQAIQRTQRWVAATPASQTDRTRRSQILQMMLGTIHQPQVLWEGAVSVPLEIR